MSKRTAVDLQTLPTSDLLIMLTNEKAMLTILFGEDWESAPDDVDEAEKLFSDAHAKVVAEIDRRFPIPSVK